VDASVIVLAKVPLLAGADLADRSLYEAIESLSDVRIERSSYTLRADACGKALAAPLGIQPGSPVLVCEEVTYLTDGSPILAGAITYRADAYRFRADLFRKP
jgi:GntR family transcriptional regulator